VGPHRVEHRVSGHTAICRTAGGSLNPLRLRENAGATQGPQSDERLLARGGVDDTYSDRVSFEHGTRDPPCALALARRSRAAPSTKRAILVATHRLAERGLQMAARERAVSAETRVAPAARATAVVRPAPQVRAEVRVAAAGNWGHQRRAAAAEVVAAQVGHRRVRGRDGRGRQRWRSCARLPRLSPSPCVFALPKPPPA
jgi:Tfp pilus assembly protein FimV